MIMAALTNILLNAPASGPMPVVMDENAAAEAVETWRQLYAEAGLEPAFAALLENPQAATLLKAVGAASPYLTKLIGRHPRTVLNLFESGPDQVLESWLAEPLDDSSTDALMAALRILKSRSAIIIALADLGGWWQPEQVTLALSRVATMAIEAAYAQILKNLIAKGHLKPCIPDDSGIFVLAMGKLGASELNYSSDVDLILYFDPERLPSTGDDAPRQALVRATQEFVTLLNERTADGYVHRVDLRLRPDPFSTPIIMSTHAALTYYETVGQNWERACYIKASYVAGDRTAADAFLKSLVPYVWRKHLDFAAIADIQSIKRQIDSQHGIAPEHLGGHNIKLSAGGIRDIELFVQTMQLIWGGRVPEFRLRGTVQTLHALAAKTLIGEDTRDELTDAYHALRQLEHAIQMIDDQQEHRIPDDETGLRRVAALMGFADTNQFRQAVHHVLATVMKHCRPLFAEHKPLNVQTGPENDHSGRANLVFTGNDEDPETTRTLTALGYQDPSIVAQLIRQWHSGTCRAMRSAKARELMTELIPDILTALAATSQPDRCFRDFNSLLFALPAGVQFLSLLYHQSEMIRLVAAILDSSPRLADILSHFPFVLDRYLALRRLREWPGRESLARELSSMLANTTDREAALHLCRQFNHEYGFVIGTRLLMQEMPLEEAGQRFSDLADVVVEQVWQQVSQDMAEQYGTPQGGAAGILALGKWGGQQLTLASDLDIIILFDAAEQGDCKLSPEIYYNRLAQRLVTAISARMQYGQLYSLDLRLRPYGKDGATACSFAALKEYYAEGGPAWTYEKLAMTRARLAIGPELLQQQTEEWLRGMLSHHAKGKDYLADLRELRAKIRQNLPPKAWWDVKHHAGGLLDHELLIQWLLLTHLPKYPDAWHPNILTALHRLTETGAIPRAEARAMGARLQRLSAIQQLVRLCYHDPSEDTGGEHELTPHASLRMAHLLGLETPESLKQSLLAIYAEGNKAIEGWLEKG
ncbi:bifunctional [glutamine synthetase] adenylyltransferase/[glutamine synthetase]-adenylyl-L-tyrosine phosphorylase [bacterium]|nr:bifunctional [glutamine synthetase] adenylyltransferase/[glutamine synthetase]-adenylyl-L-tyrosine phosphorylase [bacterium]